MSDNPGALLACATISMGYWLGDQQRVCAATRLHGRPRFGARAVPGSRAHDLESGRAALPGPARRRRRSAQNREELALTVGRSCTRRLARLLLHLVAQLLGAEHDPLALGNRLGA